MHKKVAWRSVRWGRLALTAIASILVLAGLLMCQGLVHYNGTIYRKRTAIFVLMALASMAAAAFSPDEDKRWKYSRSLYALLGIAAGGFAFQYITCESEGYVISLAYVPLMLSLSAVIYVLIWLAVGDLRRAVICYYWLMCLFAYAYECVYLFRGIAFKPMDILSFGTAMAVAGGYQYPLEAKHLLWLMGGVLLWTLSGWVKKTKKAPCESWIKIACTVLAAGWVWLLVSTNLLTGWKVVTTAFEEDALYYNRLQGTLATLVKECQQLSSIRPSDYSAAALTEADERLMSKRMSVNEQRPNVIVIMNESFSDLSTLWQMDTNADPLSFLHSLQENAVAGNLLVSAYGGSTCNTEHSFLTATMPAPQLNMALYSNVKKNTPSLAWQLKREGYSTLAIHPNAASNYQRDTIYPKLGFDQFLSISDFSEAEKIRGNVSDRACYEKIIERYERKPDGERLFVFNVTMQNHGGYTIGSVDQRIVLNHEAVHPELEMFLSLAAESDQALRELIEYFDQQQEPTVILLFGDHQPKLDLSAYAKQEKLSNVQKKLTQYITPFVIWANYPIEPAYVEAMSVNYLAPLLLKTAGLPMTGYDEWLLEMKEKYPVTVLSGYADHADQFREWEKEDWPDELVMMNHLRYNRLYDDQNRLPALDFLQPVTTE